MGRFRPLLSPPVHIAFTADFPARPNQFREPLVLIGGQAYRYLLFAEHFPGGLRFVSVADNAPVTRELEDRPTAIEVIFTPETGKLTATGNGQLIATHTMGAMAIAPGEIVLGENSVDPGLTAPNFTGRLGNPVVSLGIPARR